MVNFSESKACKECLAEYGFCPETRCYDHNYNQDGTPKRKEEYTPSATNGDYGPSNPWDAPGMSVRDFI